MTRLRPEVHSEPTQCGPDHGTLIVCYDGILFGTCASEYCQGDCESMGECACTCHEVPS